MKKLPVFQSFKEVYAGVRVHFFDLLRVAWLPLAAVVIARFSMVLWFDSKLDILAATNSEERKRAILMQIGPQVFALTLSLTLGLAMMAVGFHRFVLLGERSRGMFGTGLSFGRKELLYIWSSILVGVALFPPVALTGLVAILSAAALQPKHMEGTTDSGIGVGLAGIAVTAMVVVGGLVAGRWMLVLPHVAIGNSSSLRFVWSRTKGNSWRLFGYTILVFLPITLLFAASSLARAGSPLLGAAVDALIYVVTTMLSVTYLSVAYREIVGLPPEPETIGEGPRQPA